MRKYLYIIVLLSSFVFHNSNAQDLIVTNVGDSISCLIVRETNTVVQFSYAKYNQKIIREFGKDRVSSIVYRFYAERDSLRAISASGVIPIVQDTIRQIVRESSSELPAIEQETSPWGKWQFGLNGGYAYRLFRSRVRATSYEREYTDKMKAGYSFGADAFYFPWKNIGFGVKYNFYKSKAERDIRTSDNITIQFFGAAVAHRKIFPNDKTSILSAFWAGYQPYKNVARHIGQDYTMKANTMGWGLSVGIEQRISPQFALSLTGSGYMGSIYKYKKNSKGRTETVKFSYDEFEDLSRAEITLGLKFLH
jgi:hypothetical protein